MSNISFPLGMLGPLLFQSLERYGKKVLVAQTWNIKSTILVASSRNSSSIDFKSCFMFFREYYNDNYPDVFVNV